MHDLTLTLAAREDAAALAELYAMSGLGTDGSPPDAASAEARWDTMHDALPGVRVVVGRRCDGTILGALTLVVLPTMAHAGQPSAIVEDVVVHPVMQRLGLGRQLVNAAMHLAREAGCRTLALSSGATTPGALAFWEKLGLERHGVSFGVALEPAPAAA